MYISVQKAHFTACTVTSVWTLHFSQDSFKKFISNLANTLQAFHVCPCLPSYLLLARVPTLPLWSGADADPCAPRPPLGARFRYHGRSIPADSGAE